MLNWFKKHFVPHDGNEHKPHILRMNSIRYFIFAILFLEVFTFLIPSLTKMDMEGGLASVLPSILSDLTNTERQAQNLNTLTVSPVLNNAAEMKAQDMATKGYFAHTSPEGKTPWYWLAQAGYKYQYAGENLAIDFSDSSDVTTAWMNSPTHRSNIVKDKYTEVGTGIAKGIYEGKETIFVAQVYANPLIIKNNNLIQDIKTNTTIPISKNNIIKTNKVKNILGEETVTNSDNAQIAPSFEAKVETTNNASIQNTSNTENAAKESENATLWQKLQASPRNSSNIILYSIFVLISFALALYIFVKIKNHHYGLITNALIVLALILAIMIGNYFISHRNMTITQSIDYSLLD